MARMNILSFSEREKFESPPILDRVEQKNLFNFPMEIKNIANSLKIGTNKICFLLIFGYFKATGKFFPNKFHSSDIRFVAKNEGISPEEINIRTYDRSTYLRHKSIILQFFGFKEYDEISKVFITSEIKAMFRSQIKPKFILMQIVDLLKKKKIEIPSYNILSTLIVKEISLHKKELTETINRYLSDENKLILNTLLEKEPDEPDENSELNVQRYKLTLMKKFYQSIRPSKVKANIKDLQILRDLYFELEHIIQSLNLTNEGIKYYANSVIKSKVFQISRKSDDDKYLHLITFIAHQYFKLQDTLIDSFISSTQTILNSAKEEHKEKYYEGKEQRKQTINKFLNHLENSVITLSKIKKIVNLQDISEAEKIERIKTTIQSAEGRKINIKEQIHSFKKDLNLLKDDDFYLILENKSIKFQNRVSDIVKNITFNQHTSNTHLIEAIDYYKKKDGIVDKNSPMKFLDRKEKEILIDTEGKFNVSIYKALLFIKIADAIKSGTLNLTHSYKYRSLDEYLIPQKDWKLNKESYLKRADLEGIADCSNTLEKLKKEVDHQYNLTNQNYLKGENKFIKFKNNGEFSLSTPKVEVEEHEPLSDLLPDKKYISLLEVMSTIDEITNFSDNFEHWQIKYNRIKPAKKIFLAGLLGYGCNIGIKKIAKISKQIPAAELENTIRWYFSDDNINKANDSILKCMDQLPLSNIYKREKNRSHTSSDGQKFNIGVDSLNANYSFKYFGKGKGVSVYSFIDERHLLFYSNVISASEREAAYVIDGLMYNDVIKSDIHSTDTHGFSEAIYAVAHMLGFSYAPRIKN